MSNKLSDKEIRQRLVKLRNLEKLHKQARERIISQDKEIKFLKLRIKELEERNREKDKTIESFRLQLEEIKIKVFGKKKSKDDEPPKERQPAVRNSSSCQRPIPDKTTKEESHQINNCPKCDTSLIRKRIVVCYEEDIPLDQPSKEVVKRSVEQGYCSLRRKWVSATPLPSAKCIIGVKLRKYVCYLSVILRLSHQQIENHIEDIRQVNISQGEIQKILEKEGLKLRPEFERLKKRIQN